MQIERWEVERYKSIREDHSINLGEFNVLIGKNNSGKSSIIDSLKDYIEAFPNGETKDAEWITRRCTGKNKDQPILIQLTFRLNQNERRDILQRLLSMNKLDRSGMETYLERGDFSEITHTLKLFPNGYEGKLHSVFLANFDEHMVPLRTYDHRENHELYLNFNSLPNVKLDESSREFLEFKKKIENRLETWKATNAFRHPKEELPVERTDELNANGENLAKVLLTLSGLGDGRFEKISDSYSKIMPGVEGIRTPIISNNDTTVEVDESHLDAGFDLNEISSGSKEILTLITQIVLSNDDTDLLMIEEPELHLHPGAEQKIYNLIQKELSDGPPQIIVSTHSKVFLDQSAIENIVRIRRDDYTTLKGIDADEVVSDLREMGFQFSGMLQADAVVFVEGRSDKVIIKALAKRYGWDIGESNVELIDLDNWSEMVSHSRSLVKFASAFQIPYYFIADSDGEGNKLRKRGDLINQINRDDSEIWWDDISEEQIHIWEEDEIEGYLLYDHSAIAQHANVGEEEVGDIIEDNTDKDSDEIMETIFSECRPEIDEDVEAYKKVNDGQGIASRVDIEKLPSEFDSIMEEIAALVDQEEEIEESIEVDG